MDHKLIHAKKRLACMGLSKTDVAGGQPPEFVPLLMVMQTVTRFLVKGNILMLFK